MLIPIIVQAVQTNTHKNATNSAYQTISATVTEDQNIIKQ